MIVHLVRRDFVLKYKGSFLGVLWSIILPLFELLVLVFVFGKVINLRIEGYPAYVFTTLLPWNWLSLSLASAGGLFVGNRDLIRRPNCEPVFLVLVGALSNLVNYIMFLPILILLLIIYGRGPTTLLLIFPLLICIQTILIVGLGLIIATANVFYRDVQHLPPSHSGSCSF